MYVKTPPTMDAAGTSQERIEADAEAGAGCAAHEGADDEGAHGWHAAAPGAGSEPGGHGTQKAAESAAD
jgi:hypothetical protein